MGAGNAPPIGQICVPVLHLLHLAGKLRRSHLLGQEAGIAHAQKWEKLACGRFRQRPGASGGYLDRSEGGPVRAVQVDAIERAGAKHGQGQRAFQILGNDNLVIDSQGHLTVRVDAHSSIGKRVPVRSGSGFGYLTGLTGPNATRPDSRSASTFFDE